jgi:hypothetical protein
MPVRFQLVIDCKDPDLLARFWAAALGYVLEPPPEGFATWDDWRREVGLDVGIGVDKISDPRGEGPRIWFRMEPAAKVVKNRLHFDVHASGGVATTDRSVPLAVRKQRVDAEANRLADLGATITGALGDGSGDHYAVGMRDPEDNEFDINLRLGDKPDHQGERRPGVVAAPGHGVGPQDHLGLPQPPQCHPAGGAPSR